MPRVYLTKQDKLNNRLVSLIYGTMKVKHITQSQMAEKLEISQQAFGKKLKKCQFAFQELTVIFETLETPDEDIIRVMKGEGI